MARVLALGEGSYDDGKEGDGAEGEGRHCGRLGRVREEVLVREGAVRAEGCSRTARAVFGL